MLQRIKAWVLRRICKNACPNLTPNREWNAFATHVPILVGIGRHFRISSVLELGGGAYSTALFLNRDIFPHLTRLCTVENDFQWASRIEEIVQCDKRHTMVVENAAVAATLTALQNLSFDLIFIDDSKTVEERCETLQAVAVKCPEGTIVVMHDFEAPQYQIAAKCFQNRIVVPGYHPATGLLWKDAPVPVDFLESLLWRVRIGSKRFSPDDLRYWAPTLKNLCAK